MMTKRRFIENAKSARRSGIAMRWVVVLIAAAGMIANEPIQQWVAQQPLVVQMLHGLLLIAAFLSLACFGFWFDRRLLRKYGLACTNCRKSLTEMSGQIVVATGNCGHCGSRVLE